jgi:hypothetical protein
MEVRERNKSVRMLRVVFSAPNASHLECLLAAFEQTNENALFLVLAAQNGTLLCRLHRTLIIKYSIIIAADIIIDTQNNQC